MKCVWCGEYCADEEAFLPLCSEQCGKEFDEEHEKALAAAEPEVKP